MERDEIKFDPETGFFDFNSHAHVERDGNISTYTDNGKISTHTLTWSVTFLHHVELTDGGISTHTLTWSVTK